MSVRVFVPVTSSGLAALVTDGRLPGPFRAHAVTPELIEAWRDGDDEAWAYAAAAAAAESSWLARTPDAQPRRFVVAADVPAVSAVPGDDPTLVEVATDLVWKDVASALVDTEDHTDGDPDDQELAWFAAQEIAGLVRTLDP